MVNSRAAVTEAGAPPLSIVDALPNNGDGLENLLPVAALGGNLNVAVPAAWPSSPIPGRFDRLSVYLDNDLLSPVFIGSYPAGLIGVEFPLSITLLSEHFRREGQHVLTYEVIDGAGNVRNGDPSIFTVDTTAPNCNQSGYPLETFGVTVVDEALLLAHANSLPTAVPPYTEQRPGDTAVLYFSTVQGVRGLQVATAQASDFSSPINLPVPGDHVRAFANGPLYATYMLEDRAGNVATVGSIEKALILALVP
ncbi:hypothetical protein [Pseudomonas abieticivorans]|uniref:hypothetical protein n=1 Tax=Pseudomonas abieticivorans TaxID=2931382 RepID=UPI0020C01557|nr:hypothetical protein [Pseudomonas sp. PIA16]